MPLYVYACPTCEIEVEELRPFSRADDPVECPICHDDCFRAVTTFAIGGKARASAGTESGQPLTNAARHMAGCPCCAPRPRPKPPMKT